MKKRILIRAQHDAWVFGFFFMSALALLACYHYALASYGDADDYYTLAETGGPFAVTFEGGKLVRGHDTAVFRPGQSVGWSSTFCAIPGRAFAGRSDLVMLAQDGLPEQVVTTRTTRFPGDVVRCGPREYALRVPEDAVPGLYELRRTLTFREESWWPLRTSFEPLKFRVVGTPASPPPPLGEPSTR